MIYSIKSGILRGKIFVTFDDIIKYCKYVNEVIPNIFCGMTKHKYEPSVICALILASSIYGGSITVCLMFIKRN